MFWQFVPQHIAVRPLWATQAEHGPTIGGDQQVFGVSQQVPHARGCYKSGNGSGGAITPLRAALSAHAAVSTALWRRDMASASGYKL
jgi:hypothetical protein